MSRILGLVREQVFAVLFGAGNATDAFNIAFRIPNLLRDLFAEGAMSSALVPSFVKTDREEGRQRAWRMAGLVFRCLFWGLLALTGIGIWFAPELVSLYAGAYREVPDKFELTVRLTRWMFPFFPLVALAAAFMAVLNAVGVFFMPAFASALFNLVSITVGVTAAYFAPRFGFHPIEGMAFGVVAGGAAQALCQYPFLRKSGYRWAGRQAQDLAWHREPALRRMMLLMIPGTLGLAATQINILVNSILATAEGTGAVSWLNYAFRLMQFPIGVFGVALSVAVFPTVSRHWVDRNASALSETMDVALRQVFAINLPAAAGLAFLAGPIISLIFEYGRFTSIDTQATAHALAAYAVGLAFYSAVKVLVPACYAVGAVRIAVGSSVLSVALNLGLNLWLVKPFGFWGLALGTSLTAIFNAVFLCIALQRVLARAQIRLPWGRISASFARGLFCAIVMGFACAWSVPGWTSLLPDPEGGGYLLVGTRLLRVVALISEGVLILWVVSTWVGARELREVSGILLEKAKNKMRAPRS